MKRSVIGLNPFFAIVFDNVDIDDIAKIALAWEQKWGFIRGGDIAARERRWQMGNSLSVLSSERIGELATELVHKARENSLDSAVDSPFALLAKDNDIMWSGGETTIFGMTPSARLVHAHILTTSFFACSTEHLGMPDDCTVIVAHVVGRAADDVMDVDNQ
jgi:hypothetical protein